MANFSVAYKLTSAYEGGYVNHPSDKGGETYKGIARAFHPKWEGWALIDAAKKQPKWVGRELDEAVAKLPKFPKNLAGNTALDELVHTFYRDAFWKKILGDAIPNQRLANYVYDFAVNSGTVTAGRYLQRALNAHANGRFEPLVADGIIGGATLRAANAVGEDIEAVAKTYLEAREAFFRSIAQNNSSQQVFLKGWLARLKRLEKDSGDTVIA